MKVLILIFTAFIFSSSPALARNAIGDRLVGTWHGIDASGNSFEITYSKDGRYVGSITFRLFAGSRRAKISGDWRLEGSKLFYTQNTELEGVIQKSEEEYAVTVVAIADHEFRTKTERGVEVVMKRGKK